MPQRKPINWLNTSFLLTTPILALIGTVCLAVYGHIHWQTWVLFTIMIFACGFSVTAGYHRLYAHRAYQARWPVQLFYLIFGAATFEGSVLEWCTDHRNHHRYSERDYDKDPYSIEKGFWHAHIGWLIRLDIESRDFSNVEDLKANGLVRWQDKYFVPLAFFMGLIFPTAIAALWGNALGGLIIAGFLRIVMVHHSTFFINSFCHIFGKRTYCKEKTAVDNWVLALLTFGEGYHNFHHRFPIDYRNGVKFYHFDPTKWFIRGLSYVGLTTDLKRVSKEKIERTRQQAAG